MLENKSTTVSQVLTTLETTNYIDVHFYYANPLEDGYNKIMQHACSKDVWFAHRCLTELKSISTKLYSLTDNRKAEAFNQLKEPYESCLIAYAEIEELYRKENKESLSDDEVAELKAKLQFCCGKILILIEVFNNIVRYLYDSRVLSEGEFKLILQTVDRKMQIILTETSKRA